MRSVAMGAAIAAMVCVGGCGSSSDGAGPQSTSDAGSALDGGGIDYGDASPDAGWTTVDGGFATDAGVVRVDRFVTKVVSFTPGDCGGFGIPNMPGVVMGPPIGGGDTQGGLDVVSLGNAGEIVVSFDPNAIVDGPGVDFIVFENAFYAAGDLMHPYAELGVRMHQVAGVDFIVFENAFYAAGDLMHPYAELGEISVSDDGATWTTFPCTATAYPYGSCAGWHAVYSNPMNGISPIDPAAAGGDAFDLADIGVTRARYVRVRDRTHETCAAGPNRLTTNGFDLDAMAIVNASTP